MSATGIVEKHLSYILMYATSHCLHCLMVNLQNMILLGMRLNEILFLLLLLLSMHLRNSFNFQRITVVCLFKDI